MANSGISDELRRDLVWAQSGEITEYHVYRRLGGMVTDAANAATLRQIAEDEKRHCDFWKEHTGEDIRPDRWRIFKYTVLFRVFGLTFALKLMESGEQAAQAKYSRIVAAIPEAADVVRDENEHEGQLLAMINEERLQYTGSVVLGLNDALVELTGALAGYTLALQKGPLIAMTGLITGIAAAMSMAASEYLSTKTEPDDHKRPGKAAVYTGLAYIVTVGVLIAPFLFVSWPPAALLCTVGAAIVIILTFTYYISVAQGVSFRRRFAEMAVLSLSVAAISFVVGYVIRFFFGVEV